VNRKAIVVALIVSLGVAFFLHRSIQKDGGGPAPLHHAVLEPPQIVTKDVVVALKHIPARTRLEEPRLKEFLGIRAIPASAVPQLAYTNIASLANRYTAMPILKDDVLVPERILADDVIPNLARAVPPGKRAVSIAVTKVSSVGGFVQQGDYVDVIATIRPRVGEPISKIVLQDILVLAVGATYQFDGMTASMTPAIAAAKVELVTLAVTPEELERLMYLDSGAPFRLVLKNPNDQLRRISTRGATERTVLKDMGFSATGEALDMAPPPPPVQVEAPTTPATAPEPVYVPAPAFDDGKVEIQYGSRRKEDLYKYGGGRVVARPDAGPPSYEPPLTAGSKNSETE
jgi:pilus assembly protein CpaB